MNILAIGGHYDDIELGAGGTVAKFASEGNNVYFLVVTKSNYSDYEGNILRTEEQALSEGRNAAATLGATELISLNYETKKVKYDYSLIEKLNKIIDDLEIEMVITHWDKDVHQDHSAISKATLNAARHVPKILMYQSNWYQTTSFFRGSFYSDISDYIEKKIKSIKEHRVEYERRGDKWIEFVKNQNHSCGIKIGAEYAEQFEVVKWKI